MKCDCSMAAPPTAQDARQSLNASAAAIGAEIREKYGPPGGGAPRLPVLAERRGPTPRPRRPTVAQCERRGNRGGDSREIRPADRVDAALADTGRSKLRPLPVRDRV